MVPMIEYVRMHHVSFATADLAASKKFFGEILGFSEIERPDFDFPGAWYALVDRQLHLIQENRDSASAKARISRSDHVAVEVKSLDPVRQALSDAGISFQDGGNRGLGMEQVFCQDPDGHVIEFVRYD